MAKEPILVAHEVDIQQENIHGKWFFTLSVQKDFLKLWRKTVSNNILTNKNWTPNDDISCLDHGSRTAIDKVLFDSDSYEVFYMAVNRFEWVLFKNCFNFNFKWMNYN